MVASAEVGVVCIACEQLFAIVPMNSLECYPMGGYRTGPFAAPPLATGWGGFDGEDLFAM